MQPAEAPSWLTFIIPAPSAHNYWFHALVRSRRGAVRLNRSLDLASSPGSPSPRTILTYDYVKIVRGEGEPGDEATLD